MTQKGKFKRLGDKHVESNSQYGSSLQLISYSVHANGTKCKQNTLLKKLQAVITVITRFLLVTLLPFLFVLFCLVTFFFYFTTLP